MRRLGPARLAAEGRHSCCSWSPPARGGEGRGQSVNTRASPGAEMKLKVGMKVDDYTKELKTFI